MHPIITVVTVCLNSEKTISRTIGSVIEQDLSDAEYLVIDGLSTDSTLYIIESYKDLFKEKMRVISEKDNGWYDAMNKGIINSCGDFIVFLNSDDYFEKDAIRTVVQYVKENNVDTNSVVYGDSTNIYINSKGKELFRKISAPDHISIDNKKLRDGMCGIRHQSMFTGRQVFESIGGFDLEYRLHADWDFMIKCLENNIPMFHINSNLTYYSMYGVSTHPSHQERHMIRKRHHLYNTIDIHCITDQWGLKEMGKKVIGEKKWNDCLFKMHELREKKQGL